MASAVIAYVTASNRDEALTIGRAIVKERLAACANVFDGMTSVYHWQGEIEESGEAVLILKTRPDLAEPLIERVKQLHSYDCPCVVFWPITAGNREYLRWIEAETGPGPDVVA
ncbi:MAG: divalent-cation tolerance protein CutA [Maioricimonas sp. JB049]